MKGRNIGLAFVLMGCSAYNAGAESQGPSAASLVGNVFKFYSSAKSLSGTIHMTQSMENVSVTIDTALAYEGPSKIYMKQDLHSTEPHSWLITSDGSVFTYDMPNRIRFSSTRGAPRLMEAVSPGPGVNQDFRQIFRAAKLSLGEVDIPELIAIAGTPEMQQVKDQLASVSFAGKSKIGDTDVAVITGDWRSDHRFPASAKFEMYVTADGQLKRFVRKQLVAVNIPGGGQLAAQQVVTTWDVNLKVNGTPDEALFTVVK